MKGIKDKMIAGAGTIGFMALISTNSNPKIWQVTLVGIGIYEAALMAVKIARKEARRQRRKKYITVTKRDAHRWASTKIGWPMKEVG